MTREEHSIIMEYFNNKKGIKRRTGRAVGF